MAQKMMVMKKKKSIFSLLVKIIIAVGILVGVYFLAKSQGWL